MLKLTKPRTKPPARGRQSGVVLIVALIVLVAMTMAGLSMVRSMDTSNIIAGNMAFQQSATHSADTGIQSAIGWLEANKSTGVLNGSVPPPAWYVGNTSNDANYQSGAAFWTQLSQGGAGVCNLPIAGGICTGPSVDGSGNSVSIMIQRLCNGTTSVASSACSDTGAVAGSQSEGNSEGIDTTITIPVSTKAHYRITARVAGPRNSVSYVQVVVSL